MILKYLFFLLSNYYLFIFQNDLLSKNFVISLLSSL
jgi:hypothetical protein